MGGVGRGARERGEGDRGRITGTLSNTKTEK